MKIPLEDQITAVRTEFVNLRGAIEIIEDLVKKKKRDESDLRIKKMRLDELGAAINTLEWLRTNSDRIKRALAAGLPSSGR
jgi:hypothetical protein